MDGFKKLYFSVLFTLIIVVSSFASDNGGQGTPNEYMRAQEYIERAQQSDELLEQLNLYLQAARKLADVHFRSPIALESPTPIQVELANVWFRMAQLYERLNDLENANYYFKLARKNGTSEEQCDILEPMHILDYRMAEAPYEDVPPPKDLAISLGEAYMRRGLVTLKTCSYIISQTPEDVRAFYEMIISYSNGLVLDLTTDHEESTFYPSNRVKELEITLCDGTQRLYIIWVESFAISGNLSLHRYDVLTEEGIFRPTIHRLHYNAWEENQGISDRDIKHINETFNIYSKRDGPPPVIHSKHGKGRSATFALINALSKSGLALSSYIDPDSVLNEISALIVVGRRTRGPDLLTQAPQLRMISNLFLPPLRERESITTANRGTKRSYTHDNHTPARPYKKLKSTQQVSEGLFSCLQTMNS